jgi:ABC-type lipoprotein release transport system permease subunit
MGALSLFGLFLSQGLIFALLSAILGAVPGLLLVVFMECMLLKSEMLSELKRQTRLMEQKHATDTPQSD